MGKWKAEKSENGKTESRAKQNEQKQTKKKVETKWKSKIYEKLPNVTFHPLMVDHASHPLCPFLSRRVLCPGKERKRERKGGRRARRGVTGNQPENALFSVPLRWCDYSKWGDFLPSTIFVFYSQPDHPHTHRYTHTSAVALRTHAHWRTYPVAFDNSPQNVKNDEKLDVERLLRCIGMCCKLSRSHSLPSRSPTFPPWLSCSCHCAWQISFVGRDAELSWLLSFFATPFFCSLFGGIRRL